MAFENFKRKIALNYLEKKGSAYNPLLFNFLTNDFSFGTTSGKYLEYYCQVAPVGDAINKIASETSCVALFPYAKAEKESRIALPNSPFVKTFRKPNFKQTGIDFKQEGFIHYLATGNNYIYLSGVLSADKRSVYQSPLEVYNLRPDYITPVQDMSGYPEYYLYNPNGQQKCFHKSYINNINGQLIEAYVEDEGFGVLLHWKEPSNNKLFSMLYGDSPLQNVEIEINQYLEASIHNANLLRNGLSSKMLFTPKDGSNPPNQDQLDKIRDYLKSAYSGFNNAGKNLLIGMPFDVKPLDINLKDMDFEKLMRRMRVAIYNKLNIPLPMVEGEFTSNTNMKEANLNFYDKAVLPLLAKYCEYYYCFVYSNFYREDGVFEIGFEESSIPALQPRLFETVQVLQKAKIATSNELREFVGLGRCGIGGDALYVDGNQVAVAGDENMSDTIGVPAGMVNMPDEDEENDELDEEDQETLEGDETEFEEEDEPEEKAAGINLKPTDTMARNAARGLELRKKYGRGGTDVGVARAVQLRSRENLTPRTVARMVSYFARHGVNEGKNKKPNGEPSNHYIAWLLWGGDSGRSWANSKWKQIQNSRMKTKETEKDIFAKLLSTTLDIKGNRIYSDEEVEKLVNEH